MNHLAHLLLSEPGDPEDLVGNFMADAVKGRPDGRFSEGLVRGIRRHRRIDALTDADPRLIAARGLVHPSRRRLAGIFLDVAFDHFLSRNWGRFSDRDRLRFIDETVATLRAHADWMPEAMRARLPHLRKMLRGYHHIEGMAETFERMSRRRDFLEPLRGAEEDLVANFKDLNAVFLEFFPDLVAEVTRW